MSKLVRDSRKSSKWRTTSQDTKSRETKSRDTRSKNAKSKLSKTLGGKSTKGMSESQLKAILSTDAEIKEDDDSEGSGYEDKHEQL